MTPSDIADAAAACGLRELANWLPAERHAELRELLYDLVFTALHAAREARAVPEPSTN